MAGSVRCGRKMVLANEWICPGCTIIEQRTKEAAHEYSGRCGRSKGWVLCTKVQVCRCAGQGFQAGVGGKSGSLRKHWAEPIAASSQAFRWSVL